MSKTQVRELAKTSFQNEKIAKTEMKSFSDVKVVTYPSGSV
jgi:hypothetical protein